MEENSVILCDNLIKWLRTLNISLKHGNASELSDGVAIAEALTQIDSEYFTPNWKSKIKNDIGNNWRLKVSNLKKILDGVVDYHQDILSLSLPECSKPDVVNIAEKADPSDLARLLQLILSCAVNCNKKEEYIKRIMDMELSCQGILMQAIQELETLTLGSQKVILNEVGAEDVDDVDMKEILAQRCHELEAQVKVLHEEKQTLLGEVAALAAPRGGGADAGDDGDAGCELDSGGASLGPAHAGTLRYTHMRAQLDDLKHELDKMELQRDDQKARADALDKEVAIMRMRIEELQVAALENVALKDEVDALREGAAKAAALEAAVASYKKRMEEQVDLRRQVKVLERANTEYMQRAIEHEQAAARANQLRSQLDIYKKQVTELNEKLDAEMTKSDRLEVEGRRQASHAAALRRERDAALQERDALRDSVDELRCSAQGANEDNVSKELMPNDLKERLIRLEHENKLLRQNQGAQADQASVQNLLEDYAARLEKQRAENRQAHQRIMQLEATLEAPHPGLASAIEDNQRKSLQLEELQSVLAEERRRAAGLRDALAARDADLLATEDKYKRCVEKAKEVIKTLDPRTTGQQSLTEPTSGYGRGSGSSGGARGDTAHAASAAAVASEWAGGGGGPSPSEQRLLASAWYELGARCHRDAVDARLALLSAGRSFLARQRRHPPRHLRAAPPAHAEPR